MWDIEKPLVDPMGGSGTFVIEQALRARNIAPGENRHFAFERFPWFGDNEAQLWRQILQEADDTHLRADENRPP